MSNEEELPVVLSIAGSDSGGGAGIQADLKTFSALDVFGTSAITCVTAQNPDEVTGILALEPELVRQQIRAVCGGFPVRAAKTGMLYSAEIITAVAAADVRQGIPVLVVDPVMVANSGARLLQDDAVEALCNVLLPEARVVTPNLEEAQILCGHEIASVEALTAAAHEIGDRYDVACVVKGGHLGGAEAIDVLYDEGEEHVFSGPRIDTAETHGAGCAFSAALTAFLARRELMHDAVAKAKEYVRIALNSARRAGRHLPLDFHAGAAASSPS
jgi:hydroxymethylpyrimidine/phosphomethylpyrimidine kinase